MVDGGGDEDGRKPSVPTVAARSATMSSPKRQANDGMKTITKRMWLLVEDDETIRVMMKAMASALWDNLDLQVFKDGYETMAWIDKVEVGEGGMPLPELILLDIRMPGPQGHEIGKRLRNLAATSEIPIIVMTAYRFSPEERKRIERMVRPNEFIHKSMLDLDQFKTLVERALTRV